MDNKFLRDFLNVQAKLVEVPGDTPKKRKSKHGTATGKPSFPEEEGLSRFWQKEKPPKKELLEYFKNKISELNTEDAV